MFRSNFKQPAPFRMDDLNFISSLGMRAGLRVPQALGCGIAASIPRRGIAAGCHVIAAICELGKR